MKPIRPVLSFRVGIVSNVNLHADPAILARVRLSLRHVLTTVADTLGDCARRQGLCDVYASDPPILRLLSTLAPGVDHLVADIAESIGFRLEAVLPFGRAEYERDVSTAKDLATFRRLYATAGEHVFELDGVRDDPAAGVYDEARSYQAAGRTIVRNVDLVIAVWDGVPGGGMGRTADTIGFTARYGPRMWWIDLRSLPRQVLINTPTDLRWATVPHVVSAGIPRQAPPEGAAATLALRAHIIAVLCPPNEKAARHPGFIAPLLHAIEQLARRQNRSEVEEFLAGDPDAEAAGCRGWRPWELGWESLFARFLTFFGDPWAEQWDNALRQGFYLARWTRTRRPPAAALEPQAQAFWTHAKSAASGPSRAFAKRYRSSYVAVFGLAAISVTGGALAELHIWPSITGGGEFAALALILLLVVRNHFGRWQDRWIGWRMLSEYCRVQHALVPIGWSLGSEQIAPPLPQGEAAPREAWVGWYIAALMRCAPPLRDAVSPARKIAAKATVADLAEEQSNYHAQRGETHERASHRLGKVGDVFFLLTFLAVGVKLLHPAMIGEEFLPMLSVLCTVFPAVSAALFGVRAYAEFELLTWQSMRMARSFQDTLGRLELLEPERPLASQQIGAEMFAVAATMLDDMVGWAQTFRGKSVEAG